MASAKLRKGVRAEHTPGVGGLYTVQTLADKGVTNTKAPTDLRSVPGDGL